MSAAGRAERQSRRIGIVVALVLGALALSILVYHRYGDEDAVTRGRWTAEAHCGGCHDVSATAEATRRSGTPSFVLLAASGPSREAVAAFLARPHASMPAFRLADEERENLAAYMASLSPRRR